MIDDELLTAGG